MTAARVGAALVVVALAVPGRLHAAPLPQSVGGAYVMACSREGCVVDAEATADAAAAAARPRIAAALARVPESATVQGRVVVRPTLDAAVEAFRTSFALRVAALRPPGGDAPDAVSPYSCGTNLQPSYTKHHQDLFFYTQSYFTNLTAIDALVCTPTEPGIGGVLGCATSAAVLGLPPAMLGFGPAFTFDGTLTGVCVYGVTPSGVGPLPNSITIMRAVLGTNAWAIVGPDGVYLDD